MPVSKLTSPEQKHPHAAITENKSPVKPEKKALSLREKAKRAQMAIGPKTPKSSLIKTLPKTSPHRMSENQSAEFVSQIKTKIEEHKVQTKQKISASMPELKEASNEQIISALSQVDLEKERKASLQREYEDAVASNQARADHLMHLFESKQEPYVVDTLVLGAGPNAIFVAGNYHQNIVDKHGELYNPDGATELPTEVIYVGVSSHATFSDKDLGLMGQEARFISPEILSRQPADYIPDDQIVTQRASIESFAKAITVTKDHLKMPILESEAKTIEVRDKTEQGWEISDCRYRVKVKDKYIYTNKIDIATGLGRPRTLASNLFWNITKDDYDSHKGKDGIAPVVIGQYCNSIEMPKNSNVVVMGGGGTAASNVDTLIHLRKANLVSWMAGTERGFQSVRAVGDWGDKLMNEIESEGKKKVCKLININYQHDGTLNILVRDNHNNYSVLHADHFVASIGQEDKELRMLIKDVAGDKFDQMLPLYGYQEIQEKDESGHTVYKRLPITSYEDVKRGPETQPIGIISQDGKIRILGAASRSGIGLKHTPADYDTYMHLADKVSQSKPLISAPAGGLSVSADSIRQAIRERPALTYEINTASPAQLMACLHDKKKVKWIIAKRSQLLPHPSGQGYVNGFISKEHLEKVMKDDPIASHWVIDLTSLTFKNY